MTTTAMKLMTLGLMGRKAARRSGTLRKGMVEVLKGQGGNLVRCTSGTLWVTLEGDREDHVLTQNMTLPVPNLGKVIISGSGSYLSM